MARHAWSLVPMIALVVTNCEILGPQSCTLEARWGMQVSVVDAGAGTPVAEPVLATDQPIAERAADVLNRPAAEWRQARKGPWTREVSRRHRVLRDVRDRELTGRLPKGADREIAADPARRSRRRRSQA